MVCTTNLDDSLPFYKENTCDSNEGGVLSRVFRDFMRPSWLFQSSRFGCRHGEEGGADGSTTECYELYNLGS
jgi:hypothetical protein